MSIKAKLNMRVIIDPVLDADDWQLYTPKNALHIEETAAAVKAINAALRRAVRAQMTRQEAYAHVIQAMERYAERGALDTEPRGVLEDCLDAIYHTDLAL